jgi:hypothetical protein
MRISSVDFPAFTHIGLSGDRADLLAAQQHARARRVARDLELGEAVSQLEQQLREGADLKRLQRRAHGDWAARWMLAD